jgi:hypothetical protein
MAASLHRVSNVYPFTCHFSIHCCTLWWKWDCLSISHK